MAVSSILDYLLYIVIALVVVGVFALVVILLAKKGNKEMNGWLTQMTEEQKAYLRDNQVRDYDEKKHTWVQKAYVAQALDKGDKIAVKLLWYNTVIQNNTLNDFQYADVKVSKTDYEGHGLRLGSYVNMFINPEKAHAEIVF